MNKKIDPNIERAKSIYNGLQDDIQKHIVEEYIIPQLKVDELIQEFHKLIESEECRRVDYRVLLDVVGKIINHSAALSRMCELNTLGFKSLYEQHFIKGIMSFKHPSFYGKPLDSMCFEFVFRKIEERRLSRDTYISF
jgi:hypothetical protein